jgi:hypothetical protein
VTVPAVYLPARQLEHMRTALEAKALAYAALVAKQVESAVAFQDRATAREVFDAVAQDPDVENLLLLTASGEVLHSRGPPHWGWRARSRRSIARGCSCWRAACAWSSR